LSDRAVLIGACGWQYPQWTETYYPEGLPEEWRIAYYGNEYPVVLVPAAYWAQGPEAVETWLQESDTRPKFICEWSIEFDHQAQQDVQAMIAVLGDRVEGILIALEAMPDAAQLATIATLSTAHAVCLDWPNASASDLQTELARTQLAQRVSLCWHGDLAYKSLLAQGPLVLARVQCEGQTPRSLRTLLETLLASAGERQAVLLFDGQPPDLEIVDQAEVILNLL
jgi:hypothetical protein